MKMLSRFYVFTLVFLVLVASLGVFHKADANDGVVASVIVLAGESGLEVAAAADLVPVTDLAELEVDSIADVVITATAEDRLTMAIGLENTTDPGLVMGFYADAAIQKKTIDLIGTRYHSPASVQGGARHYWRGRLFPRAGVLADHLYVGALPFLA